jgi:hypothetical protein
LQKNTSSNLKLVAANSVYEIDGTFALPKNSISGCPKWRLGLCTVTARLSSFAALTKHNREWPRANDRVFSTKPAADFLSLFERKDIRNTTGR